MNILRRLSSIGSSSKSNTPGSPGQKTPTKAVKEQKGQQTKETVDKLAGKRDPNNKKGVITKLFSSTKSSKKASKKGMLLHVFVGDAQLEAPPKDKQSMRLILAGDVKQGGKDFSIASTWKEGALVTFKNTTVMGSAEDKAQATVSFTLKASPKSNPAAEETIGEAVLSTYAMESAVEKIVVLNPPSSSKSKAPVGRLSVTLFLNRFAIDFDADSHRQKNLLGGPSASSSSTLQARAPPKPSSREYSFLLNRKLNWKGERKSTFNKQTEVLLQEDMSKHMKELKRSLQAERGASAAAAAQRARSPPRSPRSKAKGKEPKLAYGTQHAPPPPRAQSPTRKTNMGVGFIGASWPRPQRAPRADEEERIASELKMAEERRLMNLKAIALDAKQRAMEARLKSEAAKMTVELQAREDDVMRRALQKQEEELARMRRSLEAQKRKGLNRAVQAHFLESEERRKLKEEVERREKAIFMQTLREAEGVAQPKDATAPAAAYSSASASSLATRSKQPHYSSTLKAASKRVGKPQPTAWMLKQRRRAERAKRVRQALQEQFAGSPSVTVPAGQELDASLREIEQRRSQRGYMQPIHHVKLNPRVVGDVSVITSAVLAPPRPPSPPPTAARAPRALSPDKPPLPPVSAEEAAARALERYRAALQRKQEQSLAKVARSSLYGAAYGKTQSKAQQRSHSAPPADRPSSVPAALTKHTVASLSRRESIGGKYSEFGFSDVYPEKAQGVSGRSVGWRSRGAAGADGDTASVDTETLVREMSREISSSGGGGARRLSRRSESVPPSSAATAKSKASSNKSKSSKPKPAGPTGSPAWVAENKRAIANMAEKSSALKRAAAQFTLAFNEPQAQLLQPPPVPAPAPGVSSSASSIPGFLSSYVNVQAMEPPSYAGIGAVASTTGSTGSKSSKSSKAGVERIVADLAAKDTPTPEAEAVEQAQQQAREAQQLKELVASVETSKGAALEERETKVLSEIASQAVAGKGKARGKGKDKAQKAEGPLSPSSNLRAALFGDGDE